jgi:4-hydroxybenzoyl-CoA thioesterase
MARSDAMSDDQQVPDFVAGDYVVNRRDLVVEWGHCDPAGIVFHPRFIEYFDWCCVLLLERATGMGKPELERVYDCAGIPIVDLKARFLGQVGYGDAVSIFSTFADLKRSSFGIRHALVHAGRVVVECEQTRVWCRHDPDNPARLKSRPIPDAVIARLRR